MRGTPEAILADRERVAALADLYGPLLTPRQREVLDLYHAQDLSLTEVAQRGGVSRQAVHDLLRRACALLELYEVRLGLLARERQRQREMAALLEALADGALEHALVLARQMAQG